MIRRAGHTIFLEDISSKRTEKQTIALDRKDFFKVIEDNGGKLKYWCGINVLILRVIIDRGFRLVTCLTRKNLDLKQCNDPFKCDKRVLES